MPTLDDVYRKFGAASEAAQLLETQLGTMVLITRGSDAGLFESANPHAARKLYDQVNKDTLGQLLRQASGLHDDLDQAADLLTRALAERNRLAHSFFRQHNFRRNSDSGRALMLQDLESLHDTLLEAYKLVMRVSGIDLGKIVMGELPTIHRDLE
jgi:hypothetical protein